MFTNPGAPEIASLLRRIRTIAVIGLSVKPHRPSHSVARAMQGYGYRIIPVNPAHAAILGEPAARDLDSVAPLLKSGEQIDLVNVFRQPRHVSAIVDDCIRLKLPALWLQDGVIDEAAAERARAAGIFTVMNRCVFRDRAQLSL